MTENLPHPTSRTYVIRLSGAHYRVYHFGDRTPQPNGSAWQVQTRSFEAMQHFLDQCRTEVRNHAELARMARAVDVGPATSEISPELTRFLARCFALGRLQIEMVYRERQSPRAETDGDGSKTSQSSPPVEQPKHQAAKVAEPKKDRNEWIEIELVGEDGKPIPNEPYELRNGSDAVVASGRLDGRGLAFHGDLDPDSYTVCFTDLDRNAWSRR